MRPLHLIPLLLPCLLDGCSNRQSAPSTVAEVPEVTAQLTEATFDEHSMYPVDLTLVADSFLVVNEAKNDVGFINVYNTASGTLVAEKGVKGSGPHDFVSPRFLHEFTTPDAFFIGDAGKISRFAVDSLAVDGYEGETVKSLPDAMRLYNYLIIDSDTLSVFSQTGEHPLTVYRPASGEVSYIDYTPSVDWTDGSDFIRNNEVFAASMTSAGGDIAIAYRNWKIISIIRPDGSVKAEITFPGFDSNRYRLRIDETGNLAADPDALIHFTRVKSTESHIFALGWDAPKSALRKAMATPAIYVIDREGNLVRTIRFPRSISSFCVSGDSIPYVTAIGDDGELHIYACRY